MSMCELNSISYEMYMSRLIMIQTNKMSKSIAEKCYDIRIKLVRP
ncbi:hypothetical protein F383_05711 [Gossypium arboreum]|uniref:Uncharacterized protein n=1 Tax=Gossypium arboreum TaxID=29729 RepID=A0A0B0PLR8_GOSAR|nr:hypothetical protein F383_05711 [Gossypium arboreum]